MTSRTLAISAARAALVAAWFACGGALLVVAITRLDVQRLTDALAGAAWMPLGLAVVLDVAVMTTKAAKWRVLLAGVGAARVTRLLLAYYAGGVTSVAVPMKLDEVGAAYTVGNAHKWLCTPRGSAFLHVRRDRQRDITPTTISFGQAWPGEPFDTPFRMRFDWNGTYDPSPWAVIPEALRFLSSLNPGGMEGLMASHRAMALEARRTLNAALSESSLCPDSMISSLAAVALPEGPPWRARSPLDMPPLVNWLYEERGIQVPVTRWPKGPRLLRVSAHAYNEPSDYEHLTTCLLEGLERGL